MATKQSKQPIILQPQARLDSIGGKALQKQIADIAAEEHDVWVIDMTEVDFIDSSGLFALVSGLKLAREKKCRFAICNVKTPVKLIFEITQLDRVFEIFDSYDALTKTLESPPLLAPETTLVAA
ncbi:MAG: STAS domain-containing protein [Oscillatoriaceae bacterium SKW80]|nr:STAS domain-containing protein [Oscillatoriaceae bacterium SKYG93]MCX8121099.1 STAS domain-containing protein [Oscillatoriaceae bacterium SKW80]MDW8453571.1 STAS domain-containing protein [Oscillatoriaceae cyanobacterium SKYGB_i_bin93]HIK26922.1 STAS domain-containing protein [Oscillatoriaceae cyanobacterium M7585_C2015_266]